MQCYGKKLLLKMVKSY